MSTPKNVVTATTIQNLIEELKTTFVRSIQLTTTSDKVDTLIGNDTNKSIRTIAAEELAAQLIPANADQALDTLQEISNWIQTHPEDAAAMYTAITNLQNKVTLGTNGTTEYSTVKEYVEAAINALNLGNYATAAQLTSLANRVSAVEGRPTGTTYTLPTAGPNTKGGVKIGTGLTMDGETLKTSLANASTTTAGLMSKEDKIKLDSLSSNSTNYTLPTASNTVKGGVKITGVDGLIMDGTTLKPALGTGLSISSAHNIYLKRASDSEKGGVIITGNDGLVMDGETLKASLPTASSTKKGSVKVRGKDGLIMDGDTIKIAYGVGLGISSLDNLYLKRATDSEKGGVIITGSDGLVMDGETLKTSLSNASTTKAGLMSKDDKIKLDSLANNPNYTLPTASSTKKGGVKITGNDGLTMDGDTIKIAYGVGLGISSLDNLYLKRATDSEKGGVKITGNDGLVMDGETLKASLSTASSTKKGGVKITGVDGLTMDGDTLKIAYGVGLSISAYDNLYLKRASDSEKGGVIITGNDGLVMDGETLKTSLSNASTTKAGLMSKDDKIKLNNLSTTVSSSAVYIPTADFDSIMAYFTT